MQRLTSNPVQELRRILNDQYSFSSIIKELIQNADDADATQFHLGWIPEWPGATHPLLTGPAAICLNDGKFRSVDAKAIGRLDEGAKGGDVATIGKYGLGMKSVFHLCEGFFYAASPNQPAADGKPFVELLNPWPEGGPHDDWGDISGATEIIFDRVAAWNHGANRWFCLVIPLRREEHLNGAEAIVRGQFPKVRALLDSYQAHELATLTTLLHGLDTLTMWNWNESRRDLEVEARLRLDNAKCSRSRFRNIQHGETNSIRVEAVDCGSPFKVLLRASGIEKLSDGEEWQNLKNDPRWPKNFTIDPVTGRSEDKNEKAKPHCAAVFSKSDRQKGALRIQTAVFLPLAKGEIESREIPGTSHFELTLHGQFFLDAGRRELFQSDSPEGSLQEVWNDLLLRRGVRPLVCPALNEFVRTCGLSGAEIKALTQALAATAFFKNARPEICSSVNWLKRVTFLPESEDWRLEPSSLGFLEIPRLDGSDSAVLRFLPALRELARRWVLVERDEPRLTLNEVTPWHAAESELQTLFDSITVDHVMDQDALTYLADFLEPLREKMPDKPRHALAAQLRACVRKHGIRLPEGVRDCFKKVIQAIPPSTWVKIGPLEKDAGGVYRELNDLSLDHVLLPPELCPNDDGDVLQLSEARAIFAWLENTRQQRPETRTAALALHVITATVSTAAKKRQELGRYQVLLVRTGGSGTSNIVLSWNELEATYLQGRLFAGGTTFLTALQAALQGEQVYSLFAPSSLDGFKVLFEADAAVTCNANTCLRFLKMNSPPLAGPTQRRELLRLLVKSIDHDTPQDGRVALRYLLHGNCAQAKNLDAVLLRRTMSDEGDYCGRLAQQALRQLGAEWRWIPEALWRGLTLEQQDLLDLRAISLSTIESLLLEAGTDWIEDLALTEDERLAFLVGVANPNLWRAAPLHLRVDGCRVSLGDKPVYLQSRDGTPVPPRMLDAVDVLKTPGTELLNQKYRSLGIEGWSAEKIIDIALESADPSGFALEILDAMESLRASKPNLSPEMLKRLREKAWLPKPNGPAVMPCDVIVLPAMDDYIQKLLSDPQVAHTFTCVAEVSSSIREHAAFSLLGQRHILPDVTKSLEILAECLGTTEIYRLGTLGDHDDGHETLQTLLVSFRQMDPTRLPALSLLKALAEAYPDRLQELAHVVLPRLRGTLGLETLRDCVTALSVVAHDGSGHYRPAARILLHAYLGDLRGHTQFDPSVLRGLALPNRAGGLTPADTLCARAEGIAPAHLLASDLCEIFPIKGNPPAPESAITGVKGTQTPESSAGVLLDYLRRWEGMVSKPARGGLLSLFGDLEVLRKEAKNLLDPKSVEGFRSELHWPQYEFSEMYGANESIHDSMHRQRFVFQLGDEKTQRHVLNLIGDCFLAPIGGEITSIFVGPFWDSRSAIPGQSGLRVRLITLREFEPGILSLQQRNQVLYESARILLDDAYNRRPDNLGKAWATLEECGQLALEIVQDQLLKNAWFYFQQLGDGKLPSLSDILREFDILSDREIELKRSTAPTANRNLAEVRERLVSLPNDLRSQIEGNRKVQSEALAAVREKMQTFEYSADSVPFELFQNSDDAAAELTDMWPDAPSPVRRIVFELTETHLAVIHWGRPLNEFWRGDFRAELGRQREYDKDLKKMLILSASAKGQRAELVTGKFGLGFKSVFFLSDRPQVMSRNLAFEVLGGFFPSQLSSEVLRELINLGSTRETANVESTVVRLPFAEPAPAKASKAMSAFEELLPITLIFSKCLKHAAIRRDRHESIFVLHESPVTADRLVTFCRVSCDRVGSILAGLRFVKLNAGNAGAVLLAVKANGFESFSDQVPTFWVTTPTQTRREAGVVVHGRFAVDVGRNQLAESPANLETAGQIGEGAGKALMALYDRASDWEGLRQTLDLSHDVTPEVFWRSLWSLVTNRRVRDDQLLSAMLCDPGAGIHRFTGEREALPTGLPEPFDRLTSIPRVRARLAGLLDANDERLDTVLAWPAIAAKWRPGALVSGARVWDVLYSKREESGQAITGVTLLDCVTCEIGDSIEVSPEAASRLGKVITRSFLKEFGDRKEYAKEIEVLRLTLCDLRFRREECGIGKVTDLVAQSVGGDEARRAAFAPADRRLHGDYEGPGIEFFLACRAELDAPVRLLAEWAQRAGTREQRKSVLEYILRGELDLAHQLQSGEIPGWLDEIPEDSLTDFSEQEQLQIRARLGLGYQSLRDDVRNEILEEFGLKEPNRPVVSDTERSLMRILEWWNKSHESELASLDSRTYPDGRFFDLRPTCPDSIEERQEWLKLFLLGSLQTIGWTSPEANRNFLNRCVERDWLLDLARNPERPGCWLDSLLQYIGEQETQIGYFQWIQRLVGLAIINEHLDDVVEAFLAVDRIREDFGLEAITTTRSSPLFQGGGPDSPPIWEVLGIGQCFVLRELTRHGVLTNRYAYPHCYLPFERTRDVVARLGGPRFDQTSKRWERSREIHDFLRRYLGEQATFGLSFDLPLWLIGDQNRSDLAGLLL